MRTVWALFTHSFRRTSAFLFAAITLLGASQILLVFAARSLQELNTFSGLAALVPDFVRQVFGSSVITLMSFRGVACLGYVHVAILAFIVGFVIALATEPANEVETRFLDLLLSHPVARHWILTRTLLLLATCICAVLGAMLAGTWLGLAWLVPADLARETFSVVPRLTLNLGALLLCWGGIALVLASKARRRSVAASIASLAAMACYLLDLIAQVWKPLRPIARYSPFHYYNAMSLITGSPGMSKDVMILAGVAAMCFVISYFLFQSRDL
jgi:hypothetical protein